MAIFDAFIKMWCLRFWLKFKSLSICKKESEDVHKIQRALIKMLTKLILVYSVRRFVIIVGIIIIIIIAIIIIIIIVW